MIEETPKLEKYKKSVSKLKTAQITDDVKEDERLAALNNYKQSVKELYGFKSV